MKSWCVHELRLLLSASMDHDRCGYGLARIRKALHKLNRLRIHAQLVRIHHAPRQQQGIELLSVRRVQRNVYRNFISPLLTVPSFNFLPCGRDTFVVAPASSSAFRGSISSDCSKPSVTQNRDLLALQIMIRHCQSS